MSNLVEQAVRQRLAQLEADVKHTEQLITVLENNNPEHPVFMGFSNTSEHLIVPSTNAVVEDGDRDILLKAAREMLEYRKDRLLLANTEKDSLFELAKELDGKM